MSNPNEWSQQPGYGSPPGYGRPPAYGTAPGAPGQYDPNYPAAPRSSGCWRFFLGFLIVGGLSGVCCCGIGSWLAMALSPIQGVAEIKQVQEQIAALDLPPGFEPKVALNVWWLDGRGAVYQRAADKGVLWLIAIPKWIAEKAPEVANGIGRRTDNGREETAEFEAEEIVDPEETIHTAKIDGKDVPFKLHEGKGRDTGRDLRTLTGSFPSGETVVHILLQAEADSLDDAEIDALLKSIKPAGK